jgi:hypothetical protein
VIEPWEIEEAMDRSGAERGPVNGRALDDLRLEEPDAPGIRPQEPRIPEPSAPEPGRVARARPAGRMGRRLATVGGVGTGLIGLGYILKEGLDRRQGRNQEEE